MTAAYPAIPARGPASAARPRTGNPAAGGPRPAVAWIGGLLGPRPGAERAARVFAGVPEQAGRARAFVARALAGCPARETLVTCAAELCANAIEHTASGAGGVFTVEVACPAEGIAYVAVTDGGSAGEPVARPLAGWQDMAEGGRGLALVAALASCWGYQDAPGSSRTVWAQATWPVAVP